MAAGTVTYSDYQYIVAYALLIAVFMLAIRTRLGYVTIYYGLALFAFSLVLLSANKIVPLFAPLSNPSGG